MNILVAVYSKSGNAAKYEKIISEAASITIPFYQNAHNKLIFKNNFTTAAAFSIHETYCPIKSYSIMVNNHFFSFNGLPVHQGLIGKSWSQVLLDELLNGKLHFDKLGGYYNALHVANDKIEAWNCYSRVEPIYWTENNDCICVGNRASLVWAIANKSLNFEYDLNAIISLVTASYLVNDYTPFKGVNVLKNGSKITVENNQLSIKPYKPYYYNESDENIENVLENICDRLIETTQFIQPFTNKVKINLSGGKDSRILSAICSNANIPMLCMTSGGPEEPDRIVASEVVKLLALTEHKVSERKSYEGVEEVDIFKKLKQHVILGEGMVNVDDPTYPVRMKPNFLLSGHGGELFKGGYDYVRSDSSPRATDEKMALAFFQNLSLRNHMFFLSDDAVIAQKVINETILENFLQSGFPFDNLYDWTYMVYREGRGIGNIRQASSYGAINYSPLLDDKVLEMVYSLPLSYRKSELLQFNILKRLDPALAYHRFADSRWKFEANGPSDEKNRDEWENRAPLPPGPKFQSSHSWRYGIDSYLRPIIKEYLLSNYNSDLFYLVDKKKLEKELGEQPPMPSSKIKSIFGILTIAYLLSGDWTK